MIPVSTTSSIPVIDAHAAQDAPASDAAHDTAPASADLATAASAPGSALARFGAEHGLHAQVQAFAYASPNGSGGTPIHAAPADPKQEAQQRAQAQTYMNEGVKLLQAHKYNAAIEMFQKGYQAYPSPAFILNEAAALRDSGRHAEAVLAYQRFLADPGATRKDEASKAMQDSRVHLDGREYTAADIAESKQLTADGAKAFREGRIEDAYKAWHEAYEHNPLPVLLHDQGICLQRLDAPYSAARMFHAYAAADPKAKDAADVQARGDKLQALAQRSPITATGMAGGKEWMARGNELLRAHRYNEAVTAYEQGFQTFPDEAFLLNKASALLDGGRYAEADLAYGRYLSNPDAPRADDARSAQLRAREHMGGREATITGVVESQRLMDEGGALYKAGKFADALQAFDRAYQLNPLAELRYNQAACIEKMGAREMAATRYEDYLREAPEASDAGKVRTHITKLHDDAKNASREAFDRGQERWQAGDYKGARSAFAEAYAQLPLPQFLYNQGAALQMAGDAAGAVKLYRLYLEMAPQAPDAARVRKQIDLLTNDSHKPTVQTTAPTGAPDAKLAAAQKAFDRGQLAWNQGRWTDAAREFADAYALKPLPQLVYNKAASLDKAGDTWGAVKAYQEYLNAAPNASDAGRVHKRIEMLLEVVHAGLMKPGD